MGCDIHFHVEHAVSTTRNTVWQRAEELVPNPWLKYHTDEEPEPAMIPENWYDDRNYDVFAMLADVRNGHAFAGAETGKGFIPIAPPRGIPVDCHESILKSLAEWGEDAHSVSFFNVGELMAYDWSQTTELLAMVQDKMPDSRWEKDGGAVQAAKEYTDHFGEFPFWAQQMVPLVMPGDSVPEGWEQFYYKSPYWNSATRFFRVIMRMARLAVLKHEGDLTAVRCVFWFDN